MLGGSYSDIIWQKKTKFRYAFMTLHYLLMYYFTKLAEHVRQNAGMSSWQSTIHYNIMFILLGRKWTYRTCNTLTTFILFFAKHILNDCNCKIIIMYTQKDWTHRRHMSGWNDRLSWKFEICMVEISRMHPKLTYSSSDQRQHAPFWKQVSQLSCMVKV